MGKLEVLGNIFKLYGNSKNEWFYNYKLSMYIFILSIVTFILYTIFGEFSGFIVLWRMLQLFVLGHIVLSIHTVLGDYIFNVEVKTWCQGVWLLLSLRIVLEILFW